MALLPILHYPDPRLRNRAEPIREVDEAIRTLVADLFETMYAAPGIGLAAVQVNVPKQIIVIDISETHSEPLCLINPRITEQRGDLALEEGCLSVPGIYEMVDRAAWIRVQALDRAGKPFELEAEDLLGVCIQHEIDHLHGRLFVDHLSRLKQDRIRKKAVKRQRQAL